MLSFKKFIAELRKPDSIEKFKKSVKDIDSVDTRKSSWKTTLKSLMSDHGFKELGAGKYASVFGNPKYPFVIKVFMKDAAYFRWLDFCMKNRRNKYVPKIKGKLIKISEMFYAIRLEKLEPVAWNDEFFQKYSDWKHSGVDPDDKDLRACFEYFEKNKRLLDIHGENVMARPNGQAVIVDPFYNWFGKYGTGYTIDPDEISDDLF